MNIQELTNIPAGQFVNGAVTGQLTSVKNIPTKNAGTMSVGKFGDDTGTIDVKSMSLNLMSWGNKTVTFSGKGMKRDEYNGYEKLDIGKGVKIEVVGEEADDHGIDDAPRARPQVAIKRDDDFVPQTLTYLMGAALQATLTDPESDGKPNEDLMAFYAVAMYHAREKAVAIIRSEVK